MLATQDFIRADAVQELLVEAGIPPQRITALGEGDRMPIADNTTPEGRAANRRVVIELVATDDRRSINMDMSEGYCLSLSPESSANTALLKSVLRS